MQWSLLLASVSVSVAPAAEKAPEPAFAVQKRWNIGGEGGWDRLTTDPVYRRLYVTRSNRVTVLDIETGTVVGEIPGSANVHSVCLDASGKYGYITDGGSAVVRVFDRLTLSVVASVPTGSGPNAAVSMRSAMPFSFLTPAAKPSLSSTRRPMWLSVPSTFPANRQARSPTARDLYLSR